MNNSNLNKKNSSFKDMDIFSWGIFIAMFLKIFSLLPTVIKVAKLKTAEDISIITPILLLIAFSILFVICIIKKYHLPLLLFCIGIVISAILLIQIVIYNNSEDNNNNNNLSKSSQKNNKYYDKINNYNNNIRNYNNKLS